MLYRKTVLVLLTTHLPSSLFRSTAKWCYLSTCLSCLPLTKSCRSSYSNHSKFCSTEREMYRTESAKKDSKSKSANEGKLVYLENKSTIHEYYLTLLIVFRFTISCLKKKQFEMLNYFSNQCVDQPNVRRNKKVDSGSKRSVERELSHSRRGFDKKWALCFH